MLGPLASWGGVVPWLNGEGTRKRPLPVLSSPLPWLNWRAHGEVRKDERGYHIFQVNPCSSIICKTETLVKKIYRIRVEVVVQVTSRFFFLILCT